MIPTVSAPARPARRDAPDTRSKRAPAPGPKTPAAKRAGALPGTGERRRGGPHTIRITYVRLADQYRLDEVTDDGVVHTELEAVSDEAFAEYLAALVANFRQLDVSSGAIDDEVGLRRRPAEARGMSTRPSPGPVRLAPGTPVTVVSDGRTRAGVVQPYEPENTLTHTFPVRFTETGQWRLLTARDVTVTQPEESAR